MFTTAHPRKCHPLARQGDILGFSRLPAIPRYRWPGSVGNPARQSQKLSAVSQPLPEDAFAFAVRIASAEVFLKVLLGVNQAVFRFRRQHASGSITCHRETCSHLGTTFSDGCALLQRMKTKDARPLTPVRTLRATGMTTTCTNECAVYV